MKRILFSIALIAFSIIAFAQAPASLFMRGTALAESTDPMEMKKIWKDFPESYQGETVMSNTYELITALKTGDYEFSSTAAGEALIASKSITVDGGDNGLVPFRIRVLFDEATPVVIVSQIEEVYMWSPWNKYVIGVFDYIGNSTFYHDYIEYSKDLWGDPRYRIKMYTEDGDLTTYAYKTAPNLSAPNDDSNENGWFDLYTTTNLETWNETIDEVEYKGTEFKLSPKRRGEGFPLEPFSVAIKFNVTENYTHVISDYNPSSVKENNVFEASVYPTLIENSVTIELKENNFAVEFISMTGNSLLKADTAGNRITLDNINLQQGIYLIKISKAEKVIGLQRVVKL